MASSHKPPSAPATALDEQKKDLFKFHVTWDPGTLTYALSTEYLPFVRPKGIEGSACDACSQVSATRVRQSPQQVWSRTGRSIPRTGDSPEHGPATKREASIEDLVALPSKCCGQTTIAACMAAQHT